MFQKILIANRGEIAVRIIRACRDLGIISVAVYSEADREALHAQIADEAICIGPANPRESYLNMQNLISAALASGAQAIHPGFGFLSENAEFAQMAIENGIAFIGPKPQTIHLLGYKSEAKRTAIAAGVPVAMGSDGAVADYAEAEAWAKKIGYPVMLKASAGGGGKGIRVAKTPEELKSAYDTASSEAQANFGDGRLYIERYVENPRHIEVQILGDTQGNVVHLFERECSIQRRHQKLLEEAPSFFLDPETREKMCCAARDLAKKVGYINAGTVEFLVDNDKNFFFCEMNTRIQVEHPVTEQVTGVDLVCEQIRIAAGEPLSFTQEDLQLRGHAIECRINAEDPAVGYINAGTVEFLVDNDKNFFFCEMNTRIQVEHPVTEQVTGVDLVCEQIRIAAGEPLSFTQEDLHLRGHAIECRINAEDPARDFAPCPGRINAMHLPGGPGVRMDTAAYQGYMIPLPIRVT